MQCRACISHWGTHSYSHRGVLTPLLQQRPASPGDAQAEITMQFCRKVLCKPCSARVTSPEEDMEYKMGSCIGISRRQVNRRGRMLSRGCLQCSIHAWEWMRRGNRLYQSGVFTQAKADREKDLSSVGGGAVEMLRKGAAECRCWEEDGRHVDMIMYMCTVHLHQGLDDSWDRRNLQGKCIWKVCCDLRN